MSDFIKEIHGLTAQCETADGTIINIRFEDLYNISIISERKYDTEDMVNVNVMCSRVTLLKELVSDEIKSESDDLDNFLNQFIIKQDDEIVRRNIYKSA